MTEEFNLSEKIEKCWCHKKRKSCLLKIELNKRRIKKWIKKNRKN